MGLIDTLFGGRSTKLQESVNQQLAYHNTVNELVEANAVLREGYGLAQLRLEDYMWSPVGGWNQGDGFDVQTVKDEADVCRQLYAINPLIKKAVTARVGMIHGRGSRIVASDERGQARVDAEIQKHSRKIFGKVARTNLEAELSTTGNVFVMREGAKQATIVPIGQIIGYVSEVDEPTNVLYWKRSYSAQETDLVSGQQKNVVVTEYIPAFGNQKPVATIGDVPVRRAARLYHIAANRQEGWVLGLPDLFAAKFWTRGHKEMFEAGHEFALAQGKVAAKVTIDRGPGTQLAASRLADEPRRDPETGEVYGYGGTAVMGGGRDYQLMGKMGSGVDFKSYDRTTGLIAAGTGVPLEVLLATSDSEETSLEQSVIDDMKLRQELWGEFYEDFLAGFNVRVVWPRIKQETVYRVQQAVEIANRTNTLTAAEKRLLALEAFGLEGSATDTPDISDHPDVLVYRAKKEIDLEYAALIAEASAVADEDSGRSTTPDQGNDQGIGKLSDGEDAHDARDAGEQEHTT